MNLPNQLTLIRIILVPLFMLFLLIRMPYGKYIAAFIFVIAASTDGLDGYIARKNKQITNLGKFMDPLADKLLISAALISLVELNYIRAWIAFIIIAREFAVTGLRAVAASEGVVIAASVFGKVKTITQIVAIIALLISDLPIPFIGLFANVSLAFAVITTIFSGVDYFYKSKGLLELK